MRSTMHVHVHPSLSAEPTHHQHLLLLRALRVLFVCLLAHSPCPCHAASAAPAASAASSTSACACSPSVGRRSFEKTCSGHVVIPRRRSGTAARFRSCPTYAGTVGHRVTVDDDKGPLAGAVQAREPRWRARILGSVILSSSVHIGPGLSRRARSLESVHCQDVYFSHIIVQRHCAPLHS